MSILACVLVDSVTLDTATLVDKENPAKYREAGKHAKGGL